MGRADVLYITVAATPPAAEEDTFLEHVVSQRRKPLEAVRAACLPGRRRGVSVGLSQKSVAASRAIATRLSVTALHSKGVLPKN